MELGRFFIEKCLKKKWWDYTKNTYLQYIKDKKKYKALAKKRLLFKIIKWYKK